MTDSAEGLRTLATAAHSGTSFVPERRAESHIQEVRAHLEGMRAWILEHAPADMVDELAAEYEAGYLKRYREWLGAMSRCMSTMITGPSNFPTRRNEKRNRSEHNRLEALVKFERRARSWMARRIKWATLPDDPGAEVREQIEKLEKQLAAMKAVNAIIRKKKLTTEQKVAGVVAATGASEGSALRWVTVPDFCGRLGFPGFELTSLGGKIKRLQAKLAVIATAPTEATTGDGWTIEENAPADRLQIIFAGKPPEEMRERLKRAGFRWSPHYGAWQRQLTEQARRAAREVLAP